MNVNEALLESWDRQSRMVDAVASRIDESNRHAKPSEDGWPLDHQLAHIHEVRYWWLGQFAPELAATLGDGFTEDQKPIEDLDAMRSHLKASAATVRKAVADALEKGTEEQGGYDHPVMFLQHMVWHEGWHVGLIFLGLRLAGREPGEEWEEPNIWGLWRTEIWPR